MKPLRFVVTCALAWMVACGGRERAPKPVAEGPNLEHAILTCNLERVKALVEDNPNVVENGLPPWYNTFPLGAAASASRICGTEIFRYLVEKDPGANVAVLNDALLGAAAMGSPEMVGLLLKHGADPNAENPQPYGLRTPLDAALAFGWGDSSRLEVARQLIAAGAKPDLWAAIALGDVRFVRAMLRREPKLATEHERPRPTPIQQALRFRQKEVARVLLEYIPDPDLEAMIAAGDERRVRDYLDHNLAAARMPIPRKGYALNIAIVAGELDIAKLLLEHGADVNAGRPRGEAMWDAVRQGDIEAVKFLLDHHADVKGTPPPRPGRMGGGLYQLAITLKHPEIAELIKQAQ